MGKIKYIILMNCDIHVNIMLKIFIHVIIFFFTFVINILLINVLINLDNKNNSERTRKLCYLCFQKLFSITIFKNMNQTGLRYRLFFCPFFLYMLYLYIFQSYLYR